MSAWLTADVVALALLAWACLFKIIPSCNLSRFRYRLWRIRDAVVDQIHDGAFEDAEQPRRFVALIEGAIVHSHEATLPRLFLLHLSMRGMPQPTPEEAFHLETVTGRDKELMVRHADALMSALARQLFLAGPSGWLVVGLASPFALTAALRNRMGGTGNDDVAVSSVLRGAREQFREGIEVGPTLVLMNQRNGGSRQSLSQCV